MISKDDIEEINKLILYTEEIPLKNKDSFEMTSKAFDRYRLFIEKYFRENNNSQKDFKLYEQDFKKAHNQFQNNTIHSLANIRTMIISNLKMVIENEDIK